MTNAPRRLSPAARAEVQSTLSRAGLADDPTRFVQLVKAAVGAVVSVRHQPDASALTDRELAELRVIGLDPEVDTAPLQATSARTAAKMAALLADTESVEEAAERMGLHPSRLRQMLSDRSMYGIKDSGEWRLPGFQFVERRLVRNLGAVLRAAPTNLHPIELFNWLTRPDPALLIAGKSVTPIQWLELGGDPEPVAAFAAEL